MFQLFAYAIAAVGTYVGAQIFSITTTGNTLEYHLFEGWNNLRDRISTWVRENQQIRVAYVVGCITAAIDEVAVQTRRAVNFCIQAVDGTGNRHTLKQCTIPADELIGQYADLRRNVEIRIEYE